MEKLAGFAIVLVGLLIIVFGGATAPKTDEAPKSGFRIPRWLDRIIQWGIGVLSVRWGLALIFGNAHFF
jgi:hypothetical protein